MMSAFSYDNFQTRRRYLAALYSVWVCCLFFCLCASENQPLRLLPYVHNILQYLFMPFNDVIYDTIRNRGKQVTQNPSFCINRGILHNIRGYDTQEVYSPSILSHSKSLGVPSVSSMELKLWISGKVNDSVTFKGAWPISDWINSSISFSISSREASISRPHIWIKTKRLVRCPWN